MAHEKPIRWFSRTIEPPGNVEALRRAISARPGAAMLESHGIGDGGGRYSIYGWEPVQRICVTADSGVDPFAELADLCRPWMTIDGIRDLPFVGGWVGVLGYEAGRFVEPAAGWKHVDGRLPLSHWGLFDTVLIHDRREGCWLAAGVELPERFGVRRPTFDDRIRTMEGFVRGCNTDEKGRESAVSRGGKWNYGRAAYFKKVAQILEYIRAGDVFQANLARRFRARLDGGAPSLYERLCATNSAPFAGYLDLMGTQVLSSSPELFLALRGREVVTRPIKGTRPRGEIATTDELARRALAESDKDRAELNMIVDLERNDLGRVCDYGSVRVVDDGTIEAHPTVFHRTATVVGRLRENVDAIDLLRATFPGGSITGAPKVRAMQIIQELEPDARGAYCGAIGYISLNGDLQLNLAIRTMTVAEGVVDLSVGGAIVADSDPEEEYLELEAKAAGMLAALGLKEETEARRSVHEAAEGGAPSREPVLR